MGGWDAPWHWVVLAIIVIALLGYKKLPEAARSLGRSLRVFKTEIKGMSQDDRVRRDAADSAAKTADEQAAQNGLGVPPPVITPRAETVPNPAARPRPTPNGRAGQANTGQANTGQANTDQANTDQSNTVQSDASGRAGQ